MNPIDPKQTVPKNHESPMAPPYVDEDPQMESVQRGLDVAENEIRSVMADVYEAEAKRSDDVDEALDDIDYEQGQPERKGPDHEPGSI
jgi:hypothetical protein